VPVTTNVLSSATVPRATTVAFGKGTARIPLALSALTGFLLWIRLAVLN
jgi:hypothetical protein